MTRNFRTTIAIIILSFLGVGEKAQAAPILFDVAADFSATSNPNGAWRYGWSTTTGSGFNLDTTQAVVSSLNVWEGIPGSDGFGNPSISFNPTVNPIVLSGTSWEPDRVVFHPGRAGQNAVIRWTAVAAGMIDIDVSFQGRDSVTGATTDVHVLHNISPLFSGLVTGFGPGSGPTFSDTLPVLPGDTIDFTVGWGVNETPLSDSTQLDARIEFTAAAVPEPTSVALLAVGSMGLIVLPWLRRRKSTVAAPAQ